MPICFGTPPIKGERMTNYNHSLINVTVESVMLLLKHW